MAGSSSPLDQFLIKKIIPIEVGGLDFSFTNSALFMFLAVALSSGFLLYGIRKMAIMPTRLQTFVELIFQFVADTLKDGASEKARKFFPLVFSLFIFVLTCNILGMIPGAFTVTSHFTVTFALAAVVFFAIVGYGFYKHGLRFLGVFAPSGVPLVMQFLMVPIELISFLARPFSLAIRLGANMMAGHILLKVIAGFAVSLGALNILFSAAPILFLMIVIAFEFLVAFIQAYIFAVLTCVYLNDAVNLH